jgi:hypothetical protein
MVMQDEFGTISRNDDDDVLIVLFKLIGCDYDGRNVHCFSMPDITALGFTGCILLQ